jgi:hypothetical protein
MTTPERNFETLISYVVDDYETGKSTTETLDLKTLTEEELFQIFMQIPEAADEIAYRSLYLDAKNPNTNS